MLQNRVNPQGTIIKTSARGTWMGNRGQLHDDNKKVVRAFKLKAWLTCLLEFNERKRQVMAPHRYTELFFLDEATAFAAGHRPCFECRRKDFTRFKSLWLKGNPEVGFHEETSIQKIDNILHEERISPNGVKITYESTIGALPDGTFILQHEKPYLLKNKLLYPWSPFGYDRAMPVLPTEKIIVLTPKSIVNTFRAGYTPQMAEK